MNIAEEYFDNHKRTFEGVNAGEYIDKEDFLSFAKPSYAETGSITWYKCEDQLPPQKYDDMAMSSDKVLAWGKGGWPQVTYYCRAANTFFAANELPFKITHWSYINEPDN